MSLDARLKQGLANLADPIPVDYELGLVRVKAVARQRERRNVMIAAFAGAAAAIALVVAGGRLADMVLGIEMPLPPADERILDEEAPEEERVDETLETDDDVVAKEEDLNEALERLADDTDAGSFSVASAPRSSGARSDSGGQSPVEKVTGSGEDEEPDPEPAPEPRTTTASYAGAAIPVGGGQSACDQGQQGAGCVSFQTEPGERTVEISITDNSGGPVAAWVQVDRDGDGDVDGEWTAICNATRTPMTIPTTGDAVVHVEINGGACPDGTDSNPTSGTVAAVFAT